MDFTNEINTLESEKLRLEEMLKRNNDRLQPSKLVALSRLMNIAKYYNGDWKPNWSDKNEYKYFIIYKGDIYKVDYYWATISNNIYFKNKKDAQAVIDNPNFRDILDAIYKN